MQNMSNHWKKYIFTAAFEKQPFRKGSPKIIALAIEACISIYCYELDLWTK